MKIMPAVAILALSCGLFWSVQAQDGELSSRPGRGGPGFGAFGLGRQMMRGGGPGGHGRALGLRSNRGGPNIYLRHSEELGLGDDQVRKIKEIRLNLVKQVSPLNSDLQVARLELQDLLDDEQVDLRKVETKMNSVGELRSKIAFALASARIETRNLLTAEQREKAKHLRSGRGGMEHGPRPGFRRHMGPGPGADQENGG